MRTGARCENECNRLKEELAFAPWAHEGGESRGLETALARSRAECESHRKDLERVAQLP
jgi:hypothetical protein